MFVLVHSPLVGPLTWKLVADELSRRGISAIAPALTNDGPPPYWQRHAEQVVATIGATDEPIYLVGHSGGGMLLPAIRQQLGRPVAGYIFADAGFPQDGKSRLDLFDPTGAEQFRASAIDGLIHQWREDDLAEVLPDPAIRKRFVAELVPMPLAVYDEPLPVFDGWPDAPLGYLLFSPVYNAAAERAQRQGWPVLHIEAGHFHTLVDPAAVAEALLDLADS